MTKTLIRFQAVCLLVLQVCSGNRFSGRLRAAETAKSSEDRQRLSAECRFAIQGPDGPCCTVRTKESSSLR